MFTGLVEGVKRLLGAGHRLGLLADQDSPTNPGCLSILTEPFDELDPPVTIDQFLEELISFMRWPIDDQPTELLLKSCEVTEHSENCFTVKVVLDGKKLDSWGYGRGDGMDRVRRWKKITIDHAKKHMVVDDYVPEAMLGDWLDEADDKQISVTSHVQLLAEQNQVEFWLFAQGQRLSNEALAEGIYVWTDRVIGEIQARAKAKVKVALGPSKKESGLQSALSEPMDAHIRFDAFFQGMVSGAKAQLSAPEGAEVMESDNEIVIMFKMEDGEATSKTVIRHNEEKGEMTINFEDGSGKLQHQTFRQLHQDPLVLEAWAINAAGERLTGARFLVEVQKEITKTIDANSSWF